MQEIILNNASSDSLQIIIDSIRVLTGKDLKTC